MTTVVVMGSCLTNLACAFLMSDYKWDRPNNAAVIRSDYFVENFIDCTSNVPPQQEFEAMLRWPADSEEDGKAWLNECFRDNVGRLGGIPLDHPSLFETLDTRRVDIILMDNLHDTHNRILRYLPKAGEPSYSLPFAINRCANEEELRPIFDYGPPLEAAESVKSWVRIVQYVQEKQPEAKIMFFTAHSCTSTDLPDRYERAVTFYRLFAPLAVKLGITLVPPFELPYELTRMPEDRDHFEWLIYRAMAGKIYLDYALMPR